MSYSSIGAGLVSAFWVGVCSIVILAVLAVILLIERQPLSTMIEDCEDELPRHQECKLIAVPEGGEL